MKKSKLGFTTAGALPALAVHGDAVFYGNARMRIHTEPPSHWDWRRACREINGHGKRRKK